MYTDLDSCFKRILLILYLLNRIIYRKHRCLFQFFKQLILYIYLFTVFDIFQSLRLILKERFVHLFAFISLLIKTRDLKVVLYCCRKRHLLIKVFT